MSMVLVTLRGKQGQEIWHQHMDRDSVYFQDFRNSMEADLAEGQSITITPVDEMNDAPAQPSGCIWA